MSLYEPCARLVLPIACLPTIHHQSKARRYNLRYEGKKARKHDFNGKKRKRAKKNHNMTSFLRHCCGPSTWM